MLFLKRRRLLFWLLKAYFKKNGKMLIVFFLLGCVGFILLNIFFHYLISKTFFVRQERIGVVGAYTIDTLPPNILSDVSLGLTTLGKDDTPKPGVAKSWIIEQNGKIYKFNLHNDLYFSDGTNLTSKDISYNFSDVKIIRPSPYAIEFHLKDSYSPFLVTLSHPIFKDNYVGIGSYKVKKIKLNGNFVESVQLVSRDSSLKTKSYYFYPTFDALKNAYALGEVNSIIGLTDIKYKNTSFSEFSNSVVSKKIDSNQLVTLFYNTQDSKYLSDTKFREAINYALPNTFPQGMRTYAPYPTNVWFTSSDDFSKAQDFTHSKLLLSEALQKNKGAVVISLKTFPQYQDTAKIIQQNLAKVNIQTNIEVVNSIPGNFQMFLYVFNIPADPDQYALWHSSQPNNITAYKSLRIDKLLEDGRKTSDITKRKAIYEEFEKYLIDDAPAAFLYYPYEYTVTKK